MRILNLSQEQKRVELSVNLHKVRSQHERRDSSAEWLTCHTHPSYGSIVTMYLLSICCMSGAGDYGRRWLHDIRYSHISRDRI